MSVHRLLERANCFYNFVDLRSGSPLDRRQDTLHAVIPLGVSEFLTLEKLKLPILLDERANGNRIGGDRGTIESAHACGLHRGYVLWSGATRRFSIEGRTWTMTFPGVSIVS